jgi:WD40 repeat protein
MYAPTPDKLKLVKDLARPEIVFALARKPGTGRIFFGGSDFTVREVDCAQAKLEPRELGRHESYVTSLALAGSSLISGAYDGKLIWWNVESGSQVRRVDAHGKWIRCVRSAPDERLVASVGDDMVCRIWDAGSGGMVRELRGHAEKTPHDFPSMLYACAFSADGRYLATGDKTGHVNVWDVETGEPAAAFDAPAFYTWDPVQRRHSIGGIRALAFAPDGASLAVGGIGKIGNIDHLEGKPLVELFDWRTAKRRCELSGEGKGLVEHIEFHPRGEWLLAAGGHTNGFFLFCDPGARKVISQVKFPNYVHDFKLNEASDQAYTVGHHKIALVEFQRT